MPKLVWRRSVGGHAAATRDPGSLYEDDDTLSRRQRQGETAIYGPGGVFYQVPPVPLPHQEGSEVATFAGESVDSGSLGMVPNPEEMSTLDVEDKTNSSARTYEKRERQCHRWKKVIPEMLGPYISLLRDTNSLRDMDCVRNRKLCRGCTNHKSLEILCMYFDKIEKIVICTCKEPALQLLSLGLFPSAPYKPTLAVDVNMLEFARGLFQNLSPNTTAWCETVEDFLSMRGFKLKTKDSLRIRFGNALQWYSTLQDTKNLGLVEVLNHVRGTSQESASSHASDQGPGIPQDNKERLESERPSEYLRQRCPLCFGGQNWHQPDDLFDSIVCVDANFTQKRRKSQGNSPPIPHQHPETLFISPDDVAAMQAEVETARPVRQKAASDNDAYEPGMRVPSATLDECHESFTAADSNRVKASTQFFDDTGLMALLCRHDRVLWLVNMTSAGEKQYYALCLLNKLYEHIPAIMRIGVLYDIGCQLHRSCVKYNFLSKVLDRITFGISVFHAYGHQWPCQVIYHPRKCQGFGLSDGEGCERFWSVIKPLIPTLRVSGYYTRLYAIDTKIKHLDNKSLLGMGQWLQRKWKMTREKKTEVATALGHLYQKGITEEILRQEWANQVQEQTKPLPKQSKYRADKEIHSIITLKETLKNYNCEIASLEDMIITDNFGPGITVFEAQAQIQDLKKKVQSAAKSVADKTSALSLAGQKNLERLLGNNFLRVRMNALAVKQRLRERLRYRKYELESFGSSYRNTVNHQKLQQHAEQQIKRKEPGIQNLARTYNKLCQELEKLIAARTVPRGARAPSKISLEGLFKLDVDHEIWQDDYLTNDLDDAVEIPRWLGDDDVRAGIKLLLQYDRCVEEEKRLVKERQSMQEWFTEEWNTVNYAQLCSENDQDTSLAYQFQEYRTQLLHLCETWKTVVSNLPCALSENWGPTDEEIKEAKDHRVTEQVIVMTREDEEEDHALLNTIYDVESDSDIEQSEDEVDGHEEAELVDAMEGFDLAEEFRL